MVFCIAYLFRNVPIAKTPLSTRGKNKPRKNILAGPNGNKVSSKDILIHSRRYFSNCDFLVKNKVYKKNNNSIPYPGMSNHSSTSKCCIRLLNVGFKEN